MLLLDSVNVAMQHYLNKRNQKSVYKNKSAYQWSIYSKLIPCCTKAVMQAISYLDNQEWNVERYSKTK